MSAPPESFYVADGKDFASTELTRGPWHPGSQHAGPPAALIGRAVESLPADHPMQVGRITYEILRPVPIAPLRVEAEIVRPGRRVQMFEATLRAGDEALMRARGWRVRVGEFEVPAGLSSTEPAAAPSPSAQVLKPATVPPFPEEGQVVPFFDTGQDAGYHTAMDLRFVAGAFQEPGPAIAWLRMRHELVAGEEPTPLQRVLAAADTGNGISATLDVRHHLFINVDLSVHLARLPEGEWVGLDAVTLPETTGIGITDTALFDRRGPLGRAAQTLLVAKRD